MKIKISDVPGKINKYVGIAASITIGIAITLTAAVHIKVCLKELKVNKKPKVKKVFIVKDSCDDEKYYGSCNSEDTCSENTCSVESDSCRKKNKK